MKSSFAGFLGMLELREADSRAEAILKKEDVIIFLRRVEVRRKIKEIA